MVCRRAVASQPAAAASHRRPSPPLENTEQRMSEGGGKRSSMASAKQMFEEKAKVGLRGKLPFPLPPSWMGDVLMAHTRVRDPRVAGGCGPSRRRAEVHGFAHLHPARAVRRVRQKGLPPREGPGRCARPQELSSLRPAFSRLRHPRARVSCVVVVVHVTRVPRRRQSLPQGVLQMRLLQVDAEAGLLRLASGYADSGGPSLRVVMEAEVEEVD